ncbi:MAG: hypothetical protein H7308_00595 [Chthonomonadaceae bacterium]|nr:hypothetical protein [Chthonomonadaceae bacterium]
MLKDIIGFGKQLVSLTRDVDQNKTAVKEVRIEVKELREEVNKLRQELNGLARVVERLAFELQKDRESASQERRIQLLEIENRFLRFERSSLPPPS